MYKKVLIIVLFVCICLLSTGLVVVWLTFKWVHTTSQAPKAHLHEMQKLNIPKREENLHTIVEEDEHIAFSKS